MPSVIDDSAFIAFPFFFSPAITQHLAHLVRELAVGAAGALRQLAGHLRGSALT